MLAKGRRGITQAPLDIAELKWRAGIGDVAAEIFVMDGFAKFAMLQLGIFKKVFAVAYR